MGSMMWEKLFMNLQKKFVNPTNLCAAFMELGIGHWRIEDTFLGSISRCPGEITYPKNSTLVVSKSTQGLNPPFFLPMKKTPVPAEEVELRINPLWKRSSIYSFKTDNSGSIKVKIHPKGMAAPELALDDYALKERKKSNIILLCLLVLHIPPVSRISAASSCNLKLTQAYEDYEYYQDGDIIIGAVLTVNLYAVTRKFPQFTKDPMIFCVRPDARNYVNVLNFFFGIEKINSLTSVLPNITLGYHLYDSCLDPRKAVKSVLQILSGPRKTVPNYSCMGYNKVAGFIGDHHSLTTVPIAQILGVYGYPHISYGATDPVLSDRQVYPHFFRMLQNDSVYYKIIAQLLKHFGWTWVGILASDDDSGETESLALIKYLTSNGMCVALTIKLSVFTYKGTDAEVKSRRDIVQKSPTQIFVICGSFNLAIITVLVREADMFYGKTLILPPSWSSNGYFISGNRFVEPLNGSISIELYDIQLPAYGSFFDNINPSKLPNDKLLEDIFLTTFLCLSPNSSKNSLYASLYAVSFYNCTGNGKVIKVKDFVSRGVSPRVYYAIITFAFSLHEMHSKGRNIQSYNKHQVGVAADQGSEVAASGIDVLLKPGLVDDTTEQLRYYMKRIKNIFKTGTEVFFDDLGEFCHYYTITNMFRDYNKTPYEIDIGVFTDWAPEDQQLIVRSKSIIWRTKNNQIPRSQCSDNCLPGYRKVPRPGAQTCCYDCVQCPEGEISNRTDSENCIKCPFNEWPNEKKDQCIPRLVEFLSYNNDALAASFSFVSVLFFLITFVILVIFILFRDTPIVKANNKSLSFVLLVSIMLSFPCVFLFLGRPVDITCMLRQTSFAVIFSLAISAVLGKTVMIYIVFKATKPGNYFRNLVSIKTSSSIVVIFSSIQVLINIIWLIISPPFQELDTQSYPGKMIIQCNEGSVIAFYTVLGYMGFLAAVSFIIAFLARTLPDSFNEAKYITFSMLVFCSVWIAMIPAYLSTKGKNMVAVEIFAILTSSAGLLGCIFFPKIYIMLFRPEMNVKTVLLSSRKTKL
ncbi:vomeronasal type-2 receptor 26-like [Pelodytes ibericus]